MKPHTRTPKLTHLDERGAARMVDVSSKAVTLREAVASATVKMSALTLRLISEGSMAKGNVFEVARLAGIMAAKRTSDLIPLCHSIPLDSVTVDFTIHEENTVEVRATAKTSARTGVEMEALTAVMVASLTVYDMCKAVDRSMTVEQIRLLNKTGGKSGTFEAK